MIRLAFIPLAIIAWLPLLLLTGCTTAKSYATCDNAQRAIVLAQQAVERVCRVGD